MTIAYWCILAAIILPYISAILAKTGTNYNNKTPREFLEQIQGWRRRAHWSQLNGFEAFPAFAVAVIIAQQLQVEQGLLDNFAISFIAARIFYTIFYILNLSSLRSLFWLIGFSLVISIFIASKL